MVNVFKSINPGLNYIDNINSVKKEFCIDEINETGTNLILLYIYRLYVYYS